MVNLLWKAMKIRSVEGFVQSRDEAISRHRAP